MAAPCARVVHPQHREGAGPPEASPQNEGVKLGPGHVQTIGLQQVRHADDANQTAEILYTAMAQMNLSINIGKHGVHRAVIGVRNTGQYVPVHVLETQTRLSLIHK